MTLRIHQNFLARVWREESGGEVLLFSAHGTKEAEAAIDQAGGIGEIDLVLTDYDYGKYGCAEELLADLRRLDYQGPIVMVAAQNFAMNPSFLARQFEDGVRVAIEKPLRIKDLKEVISFGVDDNEVAIAALSEEVSKMAIYGTSP